MTIKRNMKKNNQVTPQFIVQGLIETPNNKRFKLNETKSIDIQIRGHILMLITP